MNEKVDRKYKLRKEVKNSLRSLCVLFYLYLMIFLEQFMDLICWIHNSTDRQIVIQESMIRARNLLMSALTKYSLSSTAGGRYVRLVVTTLSRYPFL